MFFAENIVHAEPPDVTNQLQKSDPYKKLVEEGFGGSRYPANIWDMQEYQGRIYLGVGNSSNKQPAPNAGPVPVLAFDPRKNKYVNEFTVDEEQIARFRIQNNTLVIPGHDPKGQPKEGNCYYKAGSRWVKVDNLPAAGHCYDVYVHEGALYAGLNGYDNILRSTDGGESWTVHTTSGMRSFTFWETNGFLFVSNYSDSVTGKKPDEVKFWRTGSKSVLDGLFPNSPPAPKHNPDTRFTGRVVVRPVPWGDELVCIGAHIFNDHQWQPFGVYHVSAEDWPDQWPEGVEVNVPGEGIPFDLLRHEDQGALDVLVSFRQGESAENPYRVEVFRTTDLENWESLFYFEAPTFARSFEEHEGDYYFGLGSYATDVSPHTGHVYRVREAEYITTGDAR